MIDLSQLQITAPVAKANGEAMTVDGSKAMTTFPDYVWQGVSATGEETIFVWAPTDGVSTKSVKRARTEWKTAPFALDSADVHKNHQTLVVHEVNHIGKFVCTQMHDQDYDDPTIKGFWDNNAIYAGIRTTDSSSDPEYQKVLDNVPMGAPFDVDVLCSRSGLVTVAAMCGGRSSFISKQITGVKRLARQHVFHGWAYNQVDRGMPGELPGEGTLVECLALEITHGPAVIVAPPAPPLSADAQLQLDIDAVMLRFKAIHEPTSADRTAAAVELNALSKKVATVTDSKLRAPLYAAITDYKAQL